MSWYSSDRRDRLPADWHRIRRAVLKRDKDICQLKRGCCVIHATDVDHVIPGDDHSMTNLVAACRACHLKKSSMEGNAALRRKLAAKKRPSARHPGSNI